MSFKDLEKKTKTVEDKHDAKAGLSQPKDALDRSDRAAPTKPAQDAAPQGRDDDIFDNMPV